MEFVLLFRNNNLKINFQSQRVFCFFNSSVPCQSPKNKFPITENVNGECILWERNYLLVLVIVKMDLIFLDYFEG